MYVINKDEHANAPLVQPFSVHGIVAPEVGRDLMSIDSLYKEGFSPLFKHPCHDVGMPELYKPATDLQEAVRIPMSYDWKGALLRWF